MIEETILKHMNTSIMTRVNEEIAKRNTPLGSDLVIEKLQLGSKPPALDTEEVRDTDFNSVTVVFNLRYYGDAWCRVSTSLKSNTFAATDTRSNMMHDLMGSTIERQQTLMPLTVTVSGVQIEARVLVYLRHGFQPDDLPSLGERLEHVFTNKTFNVAVLGRDGDVKEIDFSEGRMVMDSVTEVTVEMLSKDPLKGIAVETSWDVVPGVSRGIRMAINKGRRMFTKKVHQLSLLIDETGAV